jgi:hypothetical protein
MTGRVWLVVAAAVGAAMAMAAGGCSTTATSAAGPPNDRRVYLTCAGSCHAPEPIQDYSRAEWERILPEMIGEANLSPPEAEAVERFVFSQLR